MKKHFGQTYLLILLIVFAAAANSQDIIYSTNVDSLRKVLTIQKEDTNKVNTLNLLSDNYIDNYKYYNMDSSFKYAEQALKLSKKISFAKGQGFALLERSNYYMNLFNYDPALKDANLALQIFKAGGFKRSVAHSYRTIGGIYESDEKVPESLENLYHALKLFEELKDNQQAGYTLNMIAVNYYHQEDYNNALTAFVNALKIFKQTNSNFMKEVCYVYIAKIYKIQKNFNEAFNYDSIALKMSVKDPQLTGLAYGCMGDILTEKIKTGKKAVDHSQYIKLVNETVKDYREALKNFKNVPDSGGMGDTYEAFSKMYIFLNQIFKAQKYADSALICAQQMQGKENHEHAYLLQASIDSISGNYKHAFESYKKYILFRDSLINDKNAKTSLQTRMQYDFDKKESIAKAVQDKKDADAKRLKNQQLFIIAALGIIVLAVIVIALIQFRNSKQKQRANKLLQNQKTEIQQQKDKVELTLTELKSTQAQLIQSEKMASLGELTAGIAHEIQNPLNFVNNFSEVNTELIDELKEERNKEIRDFKNEDDILNDIKENEEKINHHGKRADAIVKNMLQHSRTSTGQKEPTNINALADEYLRLSYHGMRAKDRTFNANMQTDFDKSIGKINIIPQDIGRVLLNLFNNAFYAVNEKKKNADQSYQPTVIVQTKKLNNNIEIHVSDNGNGIPQKVVDKIFQPFFTTKPTGEGTGFGLSLSYDIIKAHGGEIKVESKEGDGGEFTILLSLNQEQ